MKPTLLEWLITGLFLAMLIAVVALSLSYLPTPRLFMWAGRFVVALMALVALYLHSDQPKR